MNISEIIAQDSKKVSDADKVEQLGTLVATARKAYSNQDSKIECPTINTTDGFFSIEHLTAATKLKLAAAEATRIRIAAIEAAKQDGVNANKVIEELIATSPVLVNLTETSTFSYL
jgi:hypothetical protein